MRKVILAALAASTLVAPLAVGAAGAQSYGDSRQDQRGDRGPDRGDRGPDRGNRGPGQGDHRDGGPGVRNNRGGPGGDWRDYRRTNPTAFHRGGYRGPNGFRYRPVNVGYRFQPGYYGRNYWVNDWQNYRLARPLGYQRWVRYGNDVVLVDIRSGTVVSVYNGFFF